MVCCAQVKKKILEVALSLIGGDEEDIEVAGGMAGRWHGMKETSRISLRLAWPTVVCMF